MFNQPAWDASKDERGFVAKSQLLDPRGLEKARILGEVMRLGPQELEECPEALLKDRAFMERAIDIHPDCLNFASSELLSSDAAFVRAAVFKSGEMLGAASTELRADKAIVRVAVRQNGHALQFASPELRNDPEIVAIAVHSAPAAYRHASAEVQLVKSIALAAVCGDRTTLENMPEPMKADPTIAFAAVAQVRRARVIDLSEKCPLPLISSGAQHRLPSFRLSMGARWSTVRPPSRPTKPSRSPQCAAMEMPSSLQARFCVYERLSFLPSPPRVLVTTVRAQQALRGDKEVALAAVGESGAALRFVSRALKADPEVETHRNKPLHALFVKGTQHPA